MPVFGVDEAVKQLKDPLNNKKTNFEKETDEFYLAHLPDDILKLGKAGGEDLNIGN